MNDDITVVVTCFNDGAYLDEAVRSALAQEGGTPRLTVVDDGSTEAETLGVLAQLPKGVNLIRQANAGTSSARNTGLRAATTPYLLVLDADDRITPSTLTLLRQPMDADPKLGFTYGLTDFFGEWEGRFHLPPYDPYKLLYRSLVGATALMRRELFDQVGGFDPALSGYEDWEFWLHALAKGWQGQRVNAVTLLYRRHGQTRQTGARGRYRPLYRQLRHKHRQLYAAASRRKLAAQSNLGWAGRLVYRWWWGARPLPARVELALHGLLWRPRSGSRSSATPEH